jgi:hypothetical protein
MRSGHPRSTATRAVRAAHVVGVIAVAAIVAVAGCSDRTDAAGSDAGRAGRRPGSTAAAGEARPTTSADPSTGGSSEPSSSAGVGSSETDFLARVGLVDDRPETRQRAIATGRSMCATVQAIEAGAGEELRHPEAILVQQVRSAVRQAATTSAAVWGGDDAAYRVIMAATVAAGRTLCPDIRALATAAFPAAGR